MELREYIAALNLQFQTGVAREHAYRPALQQFLSSLMPYAIVTNKPAKVNSNLKCVALQIRIHRY